jgi:hypothetical protein
MQGSYALQREETAAMKVVCHANAAAALGDRAYMTGTLITATWQELDVGKTYSVHGIASWDGIVSWNGKANRKQALHYLVEIGFGFPVWCPAELFEISDPALPGAWYFNYLGNEPGVLAVWGYKELALDTRHYDGLIEREPEAMELFLQRRNIAEPVRGEDNNPC